LNRRESKPGSRPIREIGEGGVEEYLIQDREHVVESIVGVLFWQTGSIKRSATVVFCSDRLVGYSERSRVVVAVRC